MIGIPGQTYASITNDLLLFQSLDLDMIGVGPYIESNRGEAASTPLNPQSSILNPLQQQAPATELMTYKVIALARILCPKANIPSTTALATLNKTFGRELGLSRGANIVMPNVTPVQYRVKYEIYPGKACLNECASACHGCMTKRILSIDRTLGHGKGGRKK